MLPGQAPSRFTMPRLAGQGEVRFSLQYSRIPQTTVTNRPRHCTGHPRATTSFLILLLVRPHPVGRVWFIDAVFVCVIAAFDLLVEETLPRVTADSLQLGNAIDDIHSQTEPVDVVVNGEFQRGVDIALLLVAANVHVAVVVAPVRQPMNQPGISVEIEDDWFVSREQRVEVSVW